MATPDTTPDITPDITPDTAPDRPTRRWLRWLAIVAALCVAALALTGVYLHNRLEASLPVLDGTVVSTGLGAPVTIERDALGVVTVRAQDRADLAHGLGFAHAQDRFFQMEYYRRTATGELAEILGGSFVEQDLEMRAHRFRAGAERIIAATPAGDLEVLEAYARGVNEGLASLGDLPFELIVLGVDPAPWTPADSVLVAYVMYEDVQDPTGTYESTIGLMQDLMPPQLADFAAPIGTSWDAPVLGSALGTPPVPQASVVDLRRGPGSSSRLARREPPAVSGALPTRNLTGSNNWAVAGSRTASGSALVANDMHQTLHVPNIWYRASMLRPDGAGGEVALHGATLPGLPALIVGSNTHIAWGYTVSHHDSKDLVLIEGVEGRPDHYRTPDGPRPFERVVEKIAVKGSGSVEREVLHTVWGPVLGEDYLGRRHALRWVGHEPDAVNFLIHELETARTAAEALDIARRMSAPNQNFVVGDASGSVGWTVLGRIPRRVGFEGRRPTSWADGTRTWDGWLSPEEVPSVLDPPDGLVWSANARVADVGSIALIGDGGYDLGARAHQIRDGLLALEVATPADMLAIQLDDRALFLERWRDLLLELLTPEVVGESADRAEFRRLVEEDWDGHASVDSVGFRLVRTYRLLVSELVFAGIAEPLYEADEDFRFFMRVPQMEGPLWALVDGRPDHLLPPGYADWTELLAEGVDRTTIFLGDNFANATWGKRNTVQPHHLFSRVLPVLRPWLDPEEVELPGDVNMPRLQNPYLGSAQRMVVAPGHETEGIFHMPGGQSGHPLSPFYTAGYRDWVDGAPTPLLPGPAQHTLTLGPASTLDSATTLGPAS